MLAVIWWMYDGYAWLTNAIATDLLRFRLLLLGGMGGFLVIALAVPTAYGVNGLAFGIGYVVVVLLHAACMRRARRSRRSTAILRIVPFNLTAAVMVARRRDRSWEATHRTSSGCSRRFCCGSRRGSRAPKGFVIEASALRRATRPRHHRRARRVDRRDRCRRDRSSSGCSARRWSRCSRSRSARALWWLYFRDEEAVEQAMTDATPTRRARLAIVAFGYWHYGLVLGVVAVAAGLKKAIGDPYEPLGSLDRPGARGRRRALHRLHGGFRGDARARIEAVIG